MGATKRAAELYCQLLSKTKTETTISIVRFGNVLGSSGSVIPKFQNKINTGEDIYIYHSELTRYFMLVSEASQLVIQASALANGGEVFVLEMGKKIKILDLAILMIRLSGYIPLIDGEIQPKKQSNSLIKIKFSKLASFEKIDETLYTTGEVFDTKHPLIKYEKNINFNKKDLKIFLKELNTNILENKIKSIVKLLTHPMINYKKFED